MPGRRAAVAASAHWRDPDGIRMPAGEVHAWEPGSNATVCGLQLSRSALVRFPHIGWADADPTSGGHADAVRLVCRRCEAAVRGRRRTRTPWQRSDPRP